MTSFRNNFIIHLLMHCLHSRDCFKKYNKYILLWVLFFPPSLLHPGFRILKQFLWFLGVRILCAQCFEPNLEGCVEIPEHSTALSKSPLWTCSTQLIAHSRGCYAKFRASQPWTWILLHDAARNSEKYPWLCSGLRFRAKVVSYRHSVCKMYIW